MTILKKNNKIKIKEKNIKNKKISGGNTDYIGYLEPDVLKNIKEEDKRKIYNNLTKRKDEYQQKFNNNFRTYQEEQKKRSQERKEKLEDKLAATKEGNLDKRHSELLEYNINRDNANSASGLIRYIVNLIFKFLYYIVYVLGVILFKLGLIIYYAIKTIILTLGGLKDLLKGSTDGLRKVATSLGSGAKDIGKFTAHGVVSVAGYITSKGTGTMDSMAQFIGKAMNGPVVVVILKYVLLILFIMLIIGIALTAGGYEYPNLNIPSNPFGDYGYGMFKDKFDYYIGDPTKRGLDSLKDFSPYTGGGIADIMEFNPSIGKMPVFNSNLREQPWGISNFIWKFMDLVMPQDIFDEYSYKWRSTRANLYRAMGISDGLPTQNRPMLNNDNNIGRCDNIYNIDLDTALGKTGPSKNTIITTYDNNITDKNKIVSRDLNNISTKENQVFSMGKPKDVIFELKPEKYMNLDYNNLPNSIKNYKFGDNLSLKDKLKITVPYTDVNGVYKLSFNDAYYTNDINKTPIKNFKGYNDRTDDIPFIDNTGSILDAEINTIRLTPFTNKSDINSIPGIYNSNKIYTL